MIESSSFSCALETDLWLETTNYFKFRVSNMNSQMSILGMVVAVSISSTIYQIMVA